MLAACIDDPVLNLCNYTLEITKGGSTQSTRGDGTQELASLQQVELLKYPLALVLVKSDIRNRQADREFNGSDEPRQRCI